MERCQPENGGAWAGPQLSHPSITLTRSPLSGRQLPLQDGNATGEHGESAELRARNLALPGGLFADAPCILQVWKGNPERNRAGGDPLFARPLPLEAAIEMNPRFPCGATRNNCLAP